MKKYFIFLEEGAKRLLHAEKERKWCLGEGSASGPEAPARAEGRAEYPAMRPRRFLPDFLRRPDAALCPDTGGRLGRRKIGGRVDGRSCQVRFQNDIPGEDFFKAGQMQAELLFLRVDVGCEGDMG